MYIHIYTCIYIIYIIHKNHIVGLYPIGPSYPRPKNLMRSSNLPKTLQDCVPWDLMVWKLWQLNGSDLIGLRKRIGVEIYGGQRSISQYNGQFPMKK